MMDAHSSGSIGQAMAALFDISSALHASFPDIVPEEIDAAEEGVRAPHPPSATRRAPPSPHSLRSCGEGVSVSFVPPW